MTPWETIFHELLSPYVHLDVLIVEATEEYHDEMDAKLERGATEIARALFEAGVRRSSSPVGPASSERF